MVSLFPLPAPQLPDFQSLLVRGSYHASAPIHLLLSQTAHTPEARAILLSPCRETLKESLIELNDQWLDKYGGNGRYAATTQRTEIFYPPTLAHLRLLLSMLHEYDGTVHHQKTTLAAAPTLLVLHEISAYFTSQTSQATTSAYLSVVASALALTTSWSPQSTTTSKLVIFDSGLSQLRLPILPSLSFDEPGGSDTRRDTLSVLLERYVQWKVEFPEAEGYRSEDEETDEDEASGVPVRKVLRLSRLDGDIGIPSGEDTDTIIWSWTEDIRVDDEGIKRTIFLWD